VINHTLELQNILHDLDPKFGLKFSKRNSIRRVTTWEW